jgi:hypothetical protein
MIRAHEFCEHGAHWTFEGCLTVFSASDYCGKGNSGAVAVVGEQAELEIFRIRKCAPDALPHVLQLPAWFLESADSQEPYVEVAEQPVWLQI